MPKGWAVFNDHRERKLAKVTARSARTIVEEPSADERYDLCKLLTLKNLETEYQSFKIALGSCVDESEQINLFVAHARGYQLRASTNSAKVSVGLELLRCSFIDQVRCYFDGMLQKLGIARPRETINRWIMECRCHFDLQKTTLDEPLIPSIMDYSSPLLKREVEKQILVRSKGFSDSSADKISTEVVKKLTEYCVSQSKKLQSAEISQIHSNAMVKENADTVIVSCNGVHHEILISHYRKLQLLYRMHDPNSVDETTFYQRLFTMLQRYRNATGFRPGEGCGHHCATPPSVLSFLADAISVKMECFASPLNSYFPFYCSMFADTDVFFGSFGSFFSFYPTEGSFEAGPPYVEEIMEATRQHICFLLERSQKPLSFVIIIPEWREYPTECIQKMDANKEGHVKRMVSISKHDHVYLDGFQHCTREKKFKPVHDTLAVFMQNEQGSKKWPIDSLFEEKFRCVWKSEADGVKNNPVFEEPSVQ